MAEKTSFFDKLLKAGEAYLDAQIAKAQNFIKAQNEETFYFGKAVTRDRNAFSGSQGYYDKAGMITFDHEKHMAYKSSVIAAIIKTRQNLVAAFSDYVPDGGKKGFRIVLKDRKKALEDLKLELFGAKEDKKQSAESYSKDVQKEIRKAVDLDSEDLEKLDELNEADENEDSEISDLEMERLLEEELEKRVAKKTAALADFIRNCGELEDRPFEARRWNFDAFLRAIVWDSLVYDQIAVELVPKEAQYIKGRFNIHHFMPIDASTIRFASPSLKNTKGQTNQTSDILYPEELLEKPNEEKQQKIILDEEKLENEEYKYVQVIRGKIERAFTQDELALGIRNPITDIYANGYSVSELQLLVGLVTSHLQTEFYNKSYFSQGFSAKGILHIKSALNRSKLEEIRRHWTHLVSGNRKSFQTPIIAGTDEVKWIPLTQSHSEMEFSNWLNYLIKMICAIYQIDPAEIGYGLRDEGGSGGSLSGDNTAQKLSQSKDKGFIPLMRFIENFINVNIIDKLDPEFKFEWTGLEEESQAEILQRQSQEVTYKKSVNEIRKESGLKPIPGCDTLVLNPVYFQWWSQFSPEGRKIMQENQMQQMAMFGGNPQQEVPGQEPQQEPQQDEVQKALKIEYYLDEGDES